MSHDVHLVGSVPMANAEAVFRTVSAAFGAKLKRIPDGETGARIDWITWLRPVFADNPAFELSEEIFRLHETAPPMALSGRCPACADRSDLQCGAQARDRQDRGGDSAR